jgi:hypothetical protein
VIATEIADLIDRFLSRLKDESCLLQTLKTLSANAFELSSLAAQNTVHDYGNAHHQNAVSNARSRLQKAVAHLLPCPNLRKRVRSRHRNQEVSQAHKAALAEVNGITPNR